jgi:hypothetical protein
LIAFAIPNMRPSSWISCEQIWRTGWKKHVVWINWKVTKLRQQTFLDPAFSNDQLNMNSPKVIYKDPMRAQLVSSFNLQSFSRRCFPPSLSLLCAQSPTSHLNETRCMDILKGPAQRGNVQPRIEAD